MADPNEVKLKKDLWIEARQRQRKERREACKINNLARQDRGYMNRKAERKDKFKGRQKNGS